MVRGWCLWSAPTPFKIHNMKRLSKIALSIFTFPGGVITVTIWLVALMFHSFVLGDRIDGTLQNKFEQAINYVSGFFWLFVGLAIFSIK